ncbi:MAG: hypothetical protein IPP90_06555 [Gemmatimonadaceae bacterium]|nr:hypothetical protein [Gemmatimonadaceae bacterium]
MHPLLRQSRVLLTLVAISLLPGCTIKDKAPPVDSTGTLKVEFGNEAERNPQLGPNDVRIVSTDGVLVLSLIGDTVRMHLSDSLRNSVGAEITKDIDSSGDQSGIGGLIAKSVSKVVTGAMGFMVRVPATDVQNLRYESGHIRFDLKNSDAKVKLNSDSNRNAVFKEEDARRFIDAVKKRADRAIAM